MEHLAKGQYRKTFERSLIVRVGHEGLPSTVIKPGPARRVGLGPGRPGGWTGPGLTKDRLWQQPGQTRATRWVDPGPGRTRTRPGFVFFFFFFKCGI